MKQSTEEFYSSSYGKLLPEGKTLKDFPRFKTVLELVLSKVPRPETALDLGGGSGEFSAGLKEIGIEEVCLTDVSTKAVADARVSGIDAYVVDSNEEALPFPGGHFDFVFCGELLEHLYNVDRCLGAQEFPSPDQCSWSPRPTWHPG